MATTPENRRPGKNGGWLKTDAGPGRPVGWKSLSTRLKEKLAENNGQAASAIIAATIRDALLEDGQSRKLLWHYIEGMPKQTIAGTIQHEHYNFDNVSRDDLLELDRILSLAASGGESGA